MSPQRILGVVLLVAGVVLLIMGINASHSMADRVSDTFTGRFTDRTTWYIVGGIASGIVGLLMVLFGIRGKNA
jgi:drug/metabolite transporter (DMT)-like permease